MIKDLNRAFQDWLEEGIARGFCSDIWCWTHDLPIIENEKTKAYVEGQDSDDPCIDCVSIYHIFETEHD